MIYQWAPTCSSFYGHASFYPTLYPTTHFLEFSTIFSAYLCTLPPRVLLNSGSFPSALQRDLSENLPRQARSKINNHETDPFDLEKLNSTPGKT